MAQFNHYILSRSELSKIDDEIHIENMWVDKYSMMELNELEKEKSVLKNSGITDNIREEVLNSMIEHFEK